MKLLVCLCLLCGCATTFAQKAEVTESLLDAVRVTRLDGICPEVNKCDGGMVQGKGYCLCLTKEETIDGEIKTTADIPEEDRTMLLVCEKGGVKSVRYRPSTESIPPECWLVLGNVPFANITMNHILTGIEILLFEQCYPVAFVAGKPNIITNSWGRCPRCLLPSELACKYPETDIEP